MRNIFLVATKILGLLQLCRAFSQLGNLLETMSYRDTQEILLKSFDVVLLFAVAYVLTCKTERIADKLKLPNEDAPHISDRHDLLYVGLKVLGVYWILMLVQIFAVLLYSILQTSEPFSTFSIKALGFPILLYSIITLMVLPILLKTDAVIKLLTRTEQIAWRKIVTGAIILLATFTVLFFLYHRALVQRMMNDPGRDATHQFIEQTLAPYLSGEDETDIAEDIQIGEPQPDSADEQADTATP